MEPFAVPSVQYLMLSRLFRYSLFCAFVLLTLALGALTLRSFWAVDSIYYYQGVPRKPPLGWSYSTVFRCSSDRGIFYYSIDHECGPQHPREFRLQTADRFPRPGEFRTPSGKPSSSRNFGILTCARLDGIPGISSSLDPRLARLLAEHYSVPAWFPLGLSALASLLLFFPARRAWPTTARRRAGLCLTCGYDLRAHQPGDKCPECATIKPAPTPTPTH
jgi:hypothetical protein